MEQVDSGRLKFVPAADFISHLSEKEQTYLLMVMERDEVSPSVGQAKRLKEISAEGKLENNIIDIIMREEKPLERKVTLDGNWVKRRFPQSMTPQQIMERINKALDLLERTERRKQEQSR
jgi:ParB family chromosome partitioning protein